MTPERVWARIPEATAHDARASRRPPTLDDALAAVAAGARPVAGGTDLVVGARQGKAPLPDGRSSRSTASRASARSRCRTPALRLGTLVTHGDIVANADDPRPVHRARRRVGDRRLARDARAGHDRRQRDERLAGDGHRRPAAVLRRDGDAAVGLGGADRRARRAVDRPGQDRRPTPRSCWSRIDVPAPAPGTGSCYVRLEYRRQMEIAVVGATAVVTVDGDASPTRGSRSRRSPRRSAGCPRPKPR